MDVVPLQVERGWGVMLIATTHNPKFRCMGTCSSADFAHDYPHFIFYFQLYFNVAQFTPLYGSISTMIIHYTDLYLSSSIIIYHHQSSSYLHIYLFLYPTSLYGSISSSSSHRYIYIYIYIYIHTIQWLGGS